MQMDLWRRRLGRLGLVAVVLAAGSFAQLRADDEAEKSAESHANAATKAAENAAAEAGKAAEAAADQAMKLAQKVQDDVAKQLEVEKDQLRKQAETLQGEHKKHMEEAQQRLNEQRDVMKKQVDQARALFSTKVGGDQGRFWLGVECREASPELRAQLDLNEGGLLVLRVAPDSPAATAGVKQHDVLVRVGDANLVHAADLAKAANSADGKPLELAIVRGGKPQNVTVQPAERKLDNVQVIAKPGAGVVFPNIQLQAVKIPENTTISIVRKGQEPATVLVQRGDEKWDVKADDLSKLPDDLRPVVEQMVGGMPNGLKFNLNANPGTIQLQNGLPVPPDGANWKFNAPNFQYKIVSPEGVVPTAPVTVAVPAAPPTPPVKAVTVRAPKQPGPPSADVMQRLDQVTRELERTQQDLKNLRDAIKSANEPKGEKE